jgi:hypothetical protein
VFLAKLKGKPCVITPHGFLEPWSLSQKRFKKQLALFAYQRALLNSAAVIQATSSDEAQHIKTWGSSPRLPLSPMAWISPLTCRSLA